MERITTRDRVFNYHDNQAEYKLPKLIYRKGKWYYADPKVPYMKHIYDIRSFLYYLDRRTSHNSWNKRVLHFNEPSQLDSFIEMYADVFGEDEDWFENKYAVLGREYVKIHGEPPELPYPLDDKQLVIIAIMLYRPLEEVLFITTGIGGSGKSTYLNIVEQLFEKDYYACTLSDLTQPFNMAEAVQKGLICGDEIGTKELNLDNLKVLASKQPVNVNPKFERPYTMKSQSCLFWSCNKPPRVDLTDSGILRRMIYYFKNTKIAKPILDLKKRKYSEEELTIIAAHAYKVINRVGDNWRQLFEDETWKLQMSVNSVYMYKDMLTYKDYSDSCKEDGLKPCGKPNWEAIREMIKEHEEKKANEELPF